MEIWCLSWVFFSRRLVAGKLAVPRHGHYVGYWVFLFSVKWEIKWTPFGNESLAILWSKTLYSLYQEKQFLVDIPCLKSSSCSCREVCKKLGSGIFVRQNRQEWATQVNIGGIIIGIVLLWNRVCSWNYFCRKQKHFKLLDIQTSAPGRL